MPNKRKTETATADERKRTSSQLVPFNNPTKNARHVKRTTLPSLPDNVLVVIFRHLEALDTSETFQKRDAFSFALANKRLFGLFRSHLYSITPRISNESLPTLTLPHTLSVVRLAGNRLRELHLSKESYDILLFLPDLCPNLRKLVLDLGFCNKHASMMNPLFSKLRSLSINRPCRQTLKSLLPPPEELHLTEVKEQMMNELVEILRHPLKKFHLHVGCGLTPPRLSERLLSVLHQVCPNMEEVCVKLLPQHHSLGFRMEQLTQHVQSVKRNWASKCQKMVLHGEGLGELMKHSHPRAFVEISIGEQTIVDDAGKCYVKGITSTEDYLRQPFLSMMPQITEIVIKENVDPRWKDLLTKGRFKRVLVLCPAKCNGLQIRADVVEVQLVTLTHSRTDWKWLQDVDEVKLVGRWLWDRIGDTIIVLKSLARLLKRFHGTRVWLQTAFRFRFQNRSNPMRAEALKTIKSLEEFEQRGGEATTVRKMLDILLEGDYGAEPREPLPHNGQFYYL